MSHPVEQDYSTTMSPVDPMRAIIQHQFPDRTHHSLEAHPGHWTFDSSAGLLIQHQPPDHAGMMMTLQPQRASPDFSSVLLFLQQQQQQQQQLYCQMMMMNHPQQYFGPSVPNAVSFRRPSMGSEASSVSVTVSATKNEQWSVIAGASVLIDKPSANKVTTALSGLELGRYACTAKGEWLAYYTEPHHGYRIFRCKCEGSAKIKALSGDTGWQLLANQGEHAVAAAAEDEDTNAATHLGLPAHIKALLLQIVVECPTIAPMRPLLNCSPLMLVTEPIPAMARPTFTSGFGATFPTFDIGMQLVGRNSSRLRGGNISCHAILNFPKSQKINSSSAWSR